MYESPIMLLQTDPFIQCVKDETDTMIIRGVARVGVHVDKDELIKALEYDRGQYEKGFHDGRMYVPPCPSNADRIRAMTDEELAMWLERIRLCCTTDLCGRVCPFAEVCYSNAEAPKEMLDWLKQLKQEVED